MKSKLKDPWLRFLNDMGDLSIASFIICAISGIFLAIPYDVNNAYDSISLMMISNPMASFIRNMHYWSAQFFLIFTLKHIWDYLSISKTFKLKKGVWLRVVISITFVFYVMISGFILKADADSMQARRIIEALILGIPLIGELLNEFLIGKEGDFQLLYVHHIATATIFIAIISYEHSRRIWSKLGNTIFTLIFFILLSILFNAPLHDGLNSILKGPWYFVGFQEILHWLSRPAYSLISILLILGLIYYFPLIKKDRAKWVRILLIVFIIAYTYFSIIGYFFRGEQWKWRWEFWEAQTPFQITLFESDPILDTITQIPIVLDKRESCMVCHDEMQGLSPSHNPQAIGCVSCHQGNPFSIDKSTSHKDMILIPGNLVDADRSCGTTDCHPEITQRIQKNIMTTLSGIVSVDRYVFNELKIPDGHFHIKDIEQSAADNHLRDLCAACHLGNPKTELGEINQLSRGGGCNACHLSYTDIALSEMQTNQDLSFDLRSHTQHPTLTINITDDHCFGCHSRSGRISTNYKGWHETQLNHEEVEEDSIHHILDDKRVFEYIQEDVHHKAGMLCVDCHTSYETMGDGTLHSHKEQQMQVACEDCHFSHEANIISLENIDPESKKIIELKKYTQEYFLRISKSGKALTNTFIDTANNAFLISKSNGKILELNPPKEQCSKGNAHQTLDCNSCHTSWTPQCIGCHNSFEEQTESYDLLENKMIKGAWVEYAGQYFAEAPTLGIVEDSILQKRTSTFTPGMILTIDKGSYTKTEDEIFHRLFAPSSAHTTSSKGRSCKSCHNDPLAIGYGRGELSYIIDGQKGKWQFKQRFANNPNDGLPEDAWIGFLEEVKELRATRTNMRPFNLEEQKSILTVGACLTCHEEDSNIMDESLIDFQKVLAKKSSNCILPVWN